MRYVSIRKFSFKTFENVNLFQDEGKTELPKCICQNCTTSLNNAYDFKNLCEKGDQELREMLRISKQENPSINFKEENDEIEGNSIEEIDIKSEPIELCTVDDEYSMSYDDGDSDHATESDHSDDEVLSIKKQKLTSLEFPCKLCGKTYRHKKSLYSHNKIAHEGKRPQKSKKLGTKEYKCEKCSKEFDRHHEYTKHMREHGFFCKYCNKQFPEPYKLRRHEVNVHQGTQCLLCKEQFKTKSLLNTHLDLSHGQEKTHICDKCSRSYFDPESLAAHKLTHDVENIFKCNECEKTFSSEYGMKKHQSNYHSTDIRKTYLCPVCGKALLSLAGYNTHLMVHSGDKKFECEHCTKKFLVKHQLMLHLRSHDGLRPYSCSICGATFILMNHLKSHSMKHTEEKKFACEICGVTMKYRNNLVHHMKNVHWGIRNYACDECPDKFYTSNLLKQHKTKVHSVVDC